MESIAALKKDVLLEPKEVSGIKFRLVGRALHVCGKHNRKGRKTANTEPGQHGFLVQFDDLTGS